MKPSGQLPALITFTTARFAAAISKAGVGANTTSNTPPKANNREDERNLDCDNGSTF
jgi:hypothetical protein